MLRRRLWVWGGTALGLALGLGAPRAQAVVTTYSDRTAWNTAVGGAPDFLVDFSAFATDTSFRTSPVDAGPFSLAQTGTESFRNLIDVSPFEFSDNNGTTHASMYTDFGRIEVTMTFDAPISAFGADLSPGTLSEGLELLVNSSSGAFTLPVSIPADSTGFLGFTTSPAESISSITFRSATNIVAGSTGEGFGLDNVAGALAAEQPSAVPEPATAALGLLVLAGVAAGATRRRTA